MLKKKIALCAVVALQISAAKADECQNIENMMMSFHNKFMALLKELNTTQDCSLIPQIGSLLDKKYAECLKLARCVRGKCNMNSGGAAWAETNMRTCRSQEAAAAKQKKQQEEDRKSASSSVATNNSSAAKSANRTDLSIRIACPIIGSDITGITGAAPAPAIPLRNCKFPAGSKGASEFYNQSGSPARVTRWDGTYLEVPPGAGLWLENGDLSARTVDAEHPVDTHPAVAADSSGCLADTAYGKDAPAVRGWVSIGCQLEREQRRLDRYIRDNEICETACKKRGRVIRPNANAKVSTADCVSTGGTAQIKIIGDDKKDDSDVIEGVWEGDNWPKNTRWCVTKTSNGFNWLKIVDELLPDSLCKTNDNRYLLLIPPSDQRCEAN